MHSHSFFVRLAPLLVASIILGGCASSNKPEPVVASSSSQSNYASRYPSELLALETGFASQQQDARAVIAAMPRMPDDVKSTDGPTLASIYAAADDAGRTSSYVDEKRRLANVQTFFTEERTEISQRVAGSADYAAKQKGCTNADVGGAAAGALKEAIDKRIEKRLRAHNEAHTLIERNRVSLGRESATLLEKQADDVASTSYIVSVGLVETKVKIKAYVDDAEGVRKGADKFIADESAFQSTPGRTDADKKASQDRVNAMNQSKGQLDSAIAQGNELLKRADNDVNAIQGDYKNAFSALQAKANDKGKK